MTTPKELIADWGARDPKIRRVWACEAPVQAVAVALELQSRLHRSVDLEWRTLIYERAG